MQNCPTNRLRWSRTSQIHHRKSPGRIYPGREKVPKKKIDDLKYSSITNNEITITYERNKHKIEDIIRMIKNEGVEIIDISTDDGNLEDVFIELTKN